MKEKKKILFDLLNVIEALELSHQDYAEFARALMERLGLSLADCFPTDQTAVLLQEVQSKCNELLKITEKLPIVGIEGVKTESVVTVLTGERISADLPLIEKSGNANEVRKDEQPIAAYDVPIEDENGIIAYIGGSEEICQESTGSAYPKGYSRNGRKLGRPQKPKTDSMPAACGKDDYAGKNPGEEICPENPVTVYPKGYSRNGRKLGRPRKPKTDSMPAACGEKDDCAGDKTADGAIAKEPAIDEEKAKSAELPVAERSETAEAENGAGKEPSFTPSSQEVTPTEGETFSAAEKEKIEELKMGKKYSMEILYRWQGRMIVSDRVMQDAMPLGVFVPYKRRTTGYARFILAATDEIAGLPVAKAQKYARNQLSPYQGNKWDILDSWQIEAAKQAQPELNQILKKIGGDPFVGLYMAPKAVNYHQMPDKIRYAVNVDKL